MLNLFNPIKTHFYVSVIFWMMYAFLTVLPENSSGTGFEIRWHRIWSAALVSLTFFVEMISLVHASRNICSHTYFAPPRLLHVCHKNVHLGI